MEEGEEGEEEEEEDEEGEDEEEAEEPSSTRFGCGAAAAAASTFLGYVSASGITGIMGARRRPCDQRKRDVHRENGRCCSNCCQSCLARDAGVTNTRGLYDRQKTPPAPPSSHATPGPIS
eukprot:GHVU01148948.1.p2 GENE.GHVU01148948.1~~GHVU01148948.1.p2  ORF type:complete len:120 (+),score=23.14 GHVU01148948.1:139-498(+)